MAVAKGGTQITHFLFADNYIIFSRATKSDWQKIQGICNLYEAASGQVLNRQKTSILFSTNTRENVKVRSFKKLSPWCVVIMVNT